MFHKEMPDNVDWLNIMKDALLPIVLILGSMMTGMFCADYKLDNIGEYLFLIWFIIMIIIFLAELNDGIKNINWFQKQNCKTGKIVISIWSSFWIKIWLTIGIISFIVGFIYG